jgi:hypothetical protein
MAPKRRGDRRDIVGSSGDGEGDGGQAGDAAGDGAGLFGEVHAGVGAGGDHRAGGEGDGVAAAVVDQPGEEAARVAGRVGAGAAEDGLAVELERRLRGVEGEVVAVVDERAEDQRAVVLQIGQLVQLGRLGPAGQAARDDFDGGADRGNAGEDVLFGDSGGAGQEVAAETEHDFELDAQHRKIAARQRGAAGVDALAGQGGALDRAVCGFGADFPAADAELAPAQEGLLGLVSGGTVGRRQPRRDCHLHGLLCVSVAQQVAQFFGRVELSHGVSLQVVTQGPRRQGARRAKGRAGTGSRVACGSTAPRRSPSGRY